MRLRRVRPQLMTLRQRDDGEAAQHMPADRHARRFYAAAMPPHMPLLPLLISPFFIATLFSPLMLIRHFAFRYAFAIFAAVFFISFSPFIRHARAMRAITPFSLLLIIFFFDFRHALRLRHFR